ncbi:AraC family transcriptional regulator [Leptospira semungkisensis]|uniref:AraC family transcriptional regulator n=1 Tax=Leptospira semungkisensis TaxID=2484985 RepID=A0A4R9G635_9LEPT|nr:AraC family transcriptional regulator [Leptospira semungkisensis]TGK06645.1 AraC family transcriptional regulator [Leptospira semungkisensis]
MDFVQKALWFIESHSRDDINLEDIAKVSGVSPFHLTRTFAYTMGVPLMRYVRGRRLSEAAKRLTRSGPNILDLALEVGYGSHEAFTRAFREQFEITPEQFRSSGDLNNISLVEAITMNAEPLPELDPPRFETIPPRLMVGITEHYDCQAPGGIPNQWQKFSSYLGNIQGQTGPTAYGVCYNFDAEGFFDYMTCVEVSNSSNIPKELKSLKLSSQKYAVFTHKGHVAGIRATFAAIEKNWLPTAKVKPAEAPNLERYGKEFNPQTGLGGIEIWIPVEG